MYCTRYCIIILKQFDTNDQSRSSTYSGSFDLRRVSLSYSITLAYFKAAYKVPSRMYLHFYLSATFRYVRCCFSCYCCC